MSIDVVMSDKQTDSHLKSPFQLNKTLEKPLKIISLPQTYPKQNGSLTGDSSPTSSITSSETSDTGNSKSLAFGSSPFSLNVKKVGSVSLSTSASFTSTAPSLNLNSSITKENLTQDEKISDLQKEILCLRKDIEAKDAKLSSSVKSIKQFWSPELKKERACRKEEAEKYLLLKEKYNISNSQNEEYRKTLEDLESELNSQQQQINQLTKQLKQNNTNNELKIKLENQIKSLQIEKEAKDDDLSLLNRNFDELESKYKQLESECDEKALCIRDLEIILVDFEKKEAEYDKEKHEFEVMYSAIATRESEFQKLEEEHQLCKQDTNALEKISELENALSKHEELYESTKVDVERLRKKDEDNLERINELEDLFLLKDKDFDQLQMELTGLQASIKEHEDDVKETSSLEINRLKEQLETKELELNKSHKNVLELQNQLKEKEKDIEELREELKTLASTNCNTTLLTQKDREISDLTAKYDKLDKYLTNREDALEHCRDELKDIKAKYSSASIAKEQLENQLFEQKSLVDRLEKQKERSRPKEETVSLAIHDELKSVNEKLKKDIADVEAEVNAVKNLLSERNEKIATLDDAIEEHVSNHQNLDSLITKLQQHMEESQKKVEDLTCERNTLKKDLEEATKKLEESETTRDCTLPSDNRSSSPVKDNKTTKHLWDELSKKETKIMELETQIKERNKQIKNLKKTQNAEKKEQHDLVNEAKKTEANEKLVEAQNEIDKKEKRIVMLEEALRESVCIAAEREEILAQHVEVSEDASKKVANAEAEYDRVVVEKAITNIKNAFLILSLSERDALIASMKAARKRNIEELMNIKQEKLLSSISEKDTQIAHFEMQPTKKRQEIKQMKAEKERFVNELKEQNNIRMAMLNNENKDNLIQYELKDAPATQVYEAIRHLCNSSNKLEFYVDELMAFLREKNVELLSEIPTLPRKKARSYDKLKKASKNELMKELVFVEEDSVALKAYVDKLLDKLEEAPS